MFLHNFAGLGEFAVSALVDGDVNDDGTGTHGFNHIFGDEDRRQFAGDEGAEDDDVHVNNCVSQVFPFSLQPLVGEFVGIAALAYGNIRRDSGFNNLSSQALCLLAGIGANVTGIDNGAQAPGGGNCLEASNAGADDKGFSGLILPTAEKISGTKIDRYSAAIITLLYPAQVLMEERASIF